MGITKIVWLQQFEEKCRVKHGVTRDEVAELFAGAPRLGFVERGMRRDEDVYAARGQTRAGRYLVVFFVHKLDGSALIISARDMSAGERRSYARTRN
ncbi:MAG: uncharacterized protein HW416_3522 [Chloroflexi bacterium]|nr:uncharacterized protein [Chloroflexota bacterium]